MEKDEQIQKFFELCKSSSFPNREELLRGIKTGEYLLNRYSNSEVPSKQMFDIYKVRANILGEKKGNHARRLRNEVLIFVDELEKAIDDKVNFWCFSANEATQYLAFEGVNSQKILGCVLTVDKRKVSDSEWKKLWNKK